MISLAVSALLAVVAVVATYFTVRASLAIEAMRSEITALRKQGKDVFKQAQRTERTALRIIDKVYGTNQELIEMMQDPAVQRALRKEGRQ